MPILVIEDERKTADALKKGLEQSGFLADVAYSPIDGFQKLKDGEFSLVISDVIMPDMNGIELCKHIRNINTEIPILLLTALDSKKNVLQGFDAGADDYLTKPFDFRELLARVKALQKRSKGANINGEVLKFADVTLQLKNREVQRSGKKIELSVKEFKLLEYFMRYPETLFSRADLAREIWNIDFDTGTNIVEVYINYLRNKIDKPFSKRLIHNVHGMGYILQEE